MLDLHLACAAEARSEPSLAKCTGGLYFAETISVLWAMSKVMLRPGPKVRTDHTVIDQVLKGDGGVRSGTGRYAVQCEGRNGGVVADLLVPEDACSDSLIERLSLLMPSSSM